MGFLDRFKAPKTSSPRGATSPSLHFAIVDVETTGLSPVDDRIIEIAVVIIDGSGQVIHEWETLVNPGDRKAGPTAIHGILGDWLAAAPTFADIAGDLTERLEGRVLVAHNAKFDYGFIEAEFRRLGHTVSSDFACVCTMDVANQLGMPRKLDRLAAEIGLPYFPHGALEDARTAAAVLARVLKYIDPTCLTPAVLRPGRLPALTPSGIAVQRTDAVTLTTPRSFLSDAIHELPPVDNDGARNPEAAAAYLTLLEEVMEDGYISPDEQQRLIGLARTWGLSTGELDQLNREFLDVLLDVALADRSLSKHERQQIQRRLRPGPGLPPRPPRPHRHLGTRP